MTTFIFVIEAGKPSQTSKMEIFRKTVNDLNSQTIFAKISILNASMGSEYTFV